MTNNEKKMLYLRLVLFCVLAYLPLYVMTPILNNICGEFIFSKTAGAKTLVVANAVGVFGMLMPSVAHLLTRILTKEGFQNTYLALNIKGNIRCYIASVAVKLSESVLVMFLFWGIFIKGLSFTDAFPAGDWQIKAGSFLWLLAISVILFFPGFGEEWGLRGYMMPKLMKLMPKPLAIVVGGIIWGLWHAPLTVSGHNFGTDYKFYPWLGILLMCIFCIMMNAFLTLLTERTRSIYPASFCHMVNNNIGPTILLSIFCSQAVVERLADITSITAFRIMLPTNAITAIVSIVLLMRKSKKS